MFSCTHHFVRTYQTHGILFIVLMCLPLPFSCGKTTICQLFAALWKQQLFAVNCHMHSESADFLGGLRPVRHRGQEEQVRGPANPSSNGRIYCSFHIAKAHQKNCFNFISGELEDIDDLFCWSLLFVFHSLKCLSLGTSSFKLHKSICFAQVDFFHE